MMLGQDMKAHIWKHDLEGNTERDGDGGVKGKRQSDGVERG